MENKEKNEKLKFVINRYDDYYLSVNNKGKFYLTFSTFILGGMMAGYFSIAKQIPLGFCEEILFGLTLLLNIAAIISTLLAINPFLNTKKDNVNGSLIFFGDVADYHEKPYSKMWDELDEDKWYEDLKKQTHLLACGLIKKFKKLNLATLFLIIQVVLIVIFGVIILNKF